MPLCLSRANLLSNNPTRRNFLVNIGQVLLRKCDYDGAKEQFCTALEIYKTKLPEGHPKIAAAAQHLDRLEQEEALCV